MESVRKRLTLDATAGNQKMWVTKEKERIIHIDVVKELAVKPNCWMDSRRLAFKDEIFDTIFFDPPYYGGVQRGTMWFATPDKETWDKMVQKNNPGGKSGEFPSYYGVDLYKTKSALIAYIYNSVKEFERVLKQDGLLWLKWNEARIPLNNILVIFKEKWALLLRIKVSKAEGSVSKKIATYWCLFSKKSELKGEKTEELKNGK